MFRKKKRIFDTYYADIRKDQIGLYQKYFDALVTVIDIDNYTLWIRSNNFDRDKLNQDNQLMERVCREQAASHGLNPEFLRTMIHQYIFADHWLREDYRSTWVETVVFNKEKLVFLPDAQKVRRFLDVMS